LWETLAAVRVLHAPNGQPMYAAWRAAKSPIAHGLGLDLLLAVQPQVGHTPDFLVPPPRRATTSFATEIARVRRTPLATVAAELRKSRDEGANPRAPVIDRLLDDPSAARGDLSDALQRAWEGLLEPDWAAVKRVLDDDIAYCGQQLTRGGLAALFDDLHPNLSWEQNCLVAARHHDDDRDLEGAGLLLMPSVFTWPWLAIFVDPAYQPTLVYPARGAARLWAPTTTAPDRLARLLGRTRAMLLTSLDPPATTSALAAQHGLALATVADHLAALHGAGLAGRRRAGHQVHYRRTDLGQAIVDVTAE
jgi:Family of unknown function (DUF5937)